MLASAHRVRPVRLLLVAGLLILLGGCAASKQDIEQFQEDHSEFRARLVKMDQRLEHIEAELEQIRETLGENVSSSLRAMRADQSASDTELDRRFQTLTRRMEDNESRLSRLMDELQAINAALRQSVPGDTSFQATRTEARALYDQSQADYLRGEYELARSGFQQLLTNHPDSEYADDALYWIGESLLAEEMADSASAVFERVQSQYPDSDRLPGVLLKRGILAQAEGRTRRARQFYVQLVEDYPDSPEAEQAEIRLGEL